MQACVERAKVSRIRAEAARDEALKRIRELGYEDAGAAEAALEKLGEQISDTELQLQNDLADIEKRYPQLLEE